MTDKPLFLARFTDEQLALLEEALDLYSRLQSGEFPEILKHLPVREGRQSEPLLRREIERARDLLDTAKRCVFPELGRDVYLSVGACSDEGKLAFDVFRAIRQFRYRHRTPVEQRDPLLTPEHPIDQYIPDQPLVAIEPLKGSAEAEVARLRDGILTIAARYDSDFDGTSEIARALEGIVYPPDPK